MKNKSDLTTHIGLAVLATIGLAAGAFLLRSEGPTKAETETALRRESARVAAPATAMTVAMTSTAIAQPAPRASEESMKQEYKKTGETPKALLDFGSDLGRSMLEAFKDADRAEAVFGSLRKCTENAGAADPYRAMCAANAKRLSIKFPDRFGQRYAQIERELPENFRKFLAAVTN